MLQNRCSIVLLPSIFLALLIVPQRVVKAVDFPFENGINRRYQTVTIKSSHDLRNNNKLFIEIVQKGTNNNRYKLDLTRNHDLISDKYFHKFQKNGTTITELLQSTDVKLCQYNGHVINKQKPSLSTWAVISTCDRTSYSGAFYDGFNLYFLETGSSPLPSNDLNSSGGVSVVHMLYKDTDLTDNNSFKYNSSARRHVLRKRSTDTIKGPYRVNEKTRFIELVLVFDNSEFRAEKFLSNIYKKAKDISNYLNALLAQLNILVALTGVVVWTERDEIEILSDGDKTLSNFLAYRQKKLSIQHPNDNAQLITKKVFDNGVVGKALKGPICTSNYSAGVIVDHTNVIGLLATTIAHEIGHNFGMEHDRIECDCEDKEGCIMAPSSTSIPPKHWSSCSLNFLATSFAKGMDLCLRNRPVSLFAGPTCGNGFLETGEECDCGLPQFCNNTCCDARTCKLHSNVTCGTGDCCDLTTCRYKKGGTVCRKSKGECDLSEYCTGENEFCPKDVFRMNAEVCENGQAYCFEGNCKTKTDQCKLLWGETGKSSDECYSRNINGDNVGNCGYNHLTKEYKKCLPSDVHCGMLQCDHLNEALEFGMETSAITSHAFINYRGKIVPCRSALIDLGLNTTDPGLVPNGVKCDTDKMCYNQRCVSVHFLRTSIFKNCQASSNCSGNGVCNSNGHCHCHDGFGSEYCNFPGFGGSIDSGPISDPKGYNLVRFLIAILIFVVFPTFCLLFLFSYQSECLSKFNLKKPAILKLFSTNSTSNGPGDSSGDKQTSMSQFETDNSQLLSKGGVRAAADLIATQDAKPVPFPNQFFGHFNGYSLTPINKSAANAALPPLPTSSATSLPKSNNSHPIAVVKAFNVALTPKPIVHGQRKDFELAMENCSATSDSIDDVQLKHSTKKLEISGPILQAASHKDVIVPVRPAPTAPVSKSGTLQSNKSDGKSTGSVIVPPALSSSPTVDPNKKTALNRIASFLKPQTLTSSQPKIVVPVKKPISLKNIEISQPIPLQKLSLSQCSTTQSFPQPPSLVYSKPKAGVVTTEQRLPPPIKRAQSFKSGSSASTATSVVASGNSRSSSAGDAIVNRPNFGSLRRSHSKRPTSVPFAAVPRPKIPPPPKPNENTSAPNHSIDNLLLNDRCSDSNIYAVIDEVRLPKTDDRGVDTDTDTAQQLTTSQGGLLDEIINEIQNRHTESIYSGTTLLRKKGIRSEPIENAPAAPAVYVNSPSLNTYANVNEANSLQSQSSSGFVQQLQQRFEKN